MTKGRDDLDFVRIYAKAWNTLNPQELFSYLSDGIVYESQNVFNALTGKNVVCEYLSAKMEAIKNAEPEHKVYAEIGYCADQTGNRIQLLSAPQGKPVVILSQGDKEMPIALALLKVAHAVIERIDICSVVPHPLSARRTGDYPGINSVK